MASLRAFQPLVRQVPRVLSRTTTRRFLNANNAPTLYSAHVTVTGGRAEGHIEGETFNQDLAMPGAMGGQGGKTNPEELFAAGYGACFQSAMNAVSNELGVKLPLGKEESIVESTVDLVGDLKKLDLGLRVNLKVKVKGVDKQTLERVVERTKEVCPYSRATKGNVVTNVEVEAI